MSHNNPENPPTEEQKIDWFLDSVSEKTYDSVNATCSDANIAGTLTFNKLVKLYTHKCFSRYPQFQITALVGNDNKSSITNNSTIFEQWGHYEKRNGKGKGRGHSNSQHHRHTHDKGSKGKGKGFPRHC